MTYEQKIPGIKLTDLVIGIKGGGDLATGIALRLFRSGFTRIFIMESNAPSVVRRKVAFASAVYDTTITVEGVTAVFTKTSDQAHDLWKQGKVAVFADPKWKTLGQIHPHVLVDAIIAKKNLGTHITDAPLVIGLGPGFNAPKDVHVVIETQRGHDLGRLIFNGEAAPNTSVPEAVMGVTLDRVLRSPAKGCFLSDASIEDMVTKGQIIGHVQDKPVQTKITGVIRGLIKNGSTVRQGQKLGDIDPRKDVRYCTTASDKARALGGAVLEAVVERFNR